MLALAIPWLLVLLTIAFIVSLIKKTWKVALLLAVIIIVINWWVECLPLRVMPLKITSTDNTVSIMCYNINGSGDGECNKADLIVSMIRQSNPDIVFISELADHSPYRMDSLIKQYYPYSTFPSNLCNHYFYSKYPLIKYRRLYAEKEYQLGVYVVDVVKDRDTITILGCHLASNNYNNDRSYLTPDRLKSFCDYIDYFHNIKRANSERRTETDAIIKEINSIPYSAILMGDFNDVSGSEIMCALERHQLKDAWWEGGVGYGATIHNPLSYRIDHIMYTKGLILQTIKVLCSNGVSDHDALYAVFKY